MATMPTAIRVAQTVGITAAAFCAGGTLCISYLYVPSLIMAPSPLMVRQWQKSFDAAKIIHPGIALLSSACYGFLSYTMYGTLNHPKAEMYALGALANLSIWPWTLVLLMPINKKLWRKREEMAGLKGEEEVRETGLQRGESVGQLVQTWSKLNVGRGLLPLVGAVVGMWATLN